MKQYNISKSGKDRDATMDALKDLVEEASKEQGTSVSVFVFNPEKHVIIHKEVPWILVTVGLVVGYIACRLASGL